MPSGRGNGYVEYYVTSLLKGHMTEVRMCLCKNRYATVAEANSTKEDREANTGKLLRSYYCHYCGGYHLTSKSLVNY